MTEHRILSIDIQNPRVNNSAAVPGNQNGHSGAAEKPDGWKRSNNSFTFNFFPEGMPPAVKDEPGKPQTAQSGGSTVGQGSGFTFNFQISADTAGEIKGQTVTPPTAPSEAAVAPGTQKDTQEEKPQKETNVSQTSEPPASSKAKKKKKKSGQKRKVPEGTEGPQKQVTGSTVTVASHGDDGTVLSAERQLKRELDWCIEQLELGMWTQKGTPRQKEEATRALRTLRSSKAPLAKKRQVMRAMSGDYRKKMEEEKDKQFKLIQAAMTAAQVKAVSNTAAAKKSVFHRKAECQTQTPPQKTATQPQSQPETLETQTLSPNANTGVQSQENTSAFVFTPAKEEFCFNFL